MGRKTKVALVLGTRPEVIKLAPVIRAFSRNARFDVSVVTTGQHGDLLKQTLDLFDIGPDYRLESVETCGQLDRLAAALIPAVGRALDEAKPDCVLVQGDTASAFAGAVAAYHRRFPIGHVEAGLRSGDLMQPWPEEGNRRMISHIARWHFAPTGTARDALLQEGIAAADIHITGNTGIDALQACRRRLDAHPELAPVMRQLEKRFAGQAIIGVTAHRRENIRHIGSIAAAVRRIVNRPCTAVILPLHPNPEVSGALKRILADHPSIALTDPLDYPDFVRLLDVATLMLTDSGGVQEEAPSFGTPVLVMREMTERVEGVEAGTSRLVGTDMDRIVSETLNLLDDPAYHAAGNGRPNPYGDGLSADRIVKILAREFELAPDEIRARDNRDTR